MLNTNQKKTSPPRNPIWKINLKFLKNKNENCEHELLETHAKSEKIIEAYQKKFLQERNLLEKLYQEKLSEVESKYQEHIKNLQQSHQSIYWGEFQTFSWPSRRSHSDFFVFTEVSIITAGKSLKHSESGISKTVNSSTSPLISSSIPGFFFWGIIDDPIANPSSRVRVWIS
jgi:hypothetical protein